MNKNIFKTIILSSLIISGLFFINCFNVKADECANCIYTSQMSYDDSGKQAPKAQDVVVAYAKAHVGEDIAPNVFTDLGLDIDTGASCTETAQWWMYKVYGKEAALKAIGSSEFKYRAQLLAEAPKVHQVNKNDVQPGDVGFTSGFNHTVFVVSVNGDEVKTVEGGPDVPFRDTHDKSELSFYRWDWTPLQKIENKKAYLYKAYQIIVKKNDNGMFHIAAEQCKTSEEKNCIAYHGYEFNNSNYLMEHFFMGYKWKCPKDVRISGDARDVIFNSGASNKYKTVLSSFSSTDCKLKNNLDSFVESTDGFTGKEKDDLASIKRWALNHKSFQSNFNENCGIVNEMMPTVKKIFFVIQVISILLLIVLSMIEFIKVISANDNDGLKEAFKKTIRRIIIIVIILLLPLLINWIVDISGIATCHVECSN